MSPEPHRVTVRCPDCGSASLLSIDGPLETLLDGVDPDHVLHLDWCQNEVRPGEVCGRRYEILARDLREDG